MMLLTTMKQCSVVWDSSFWQRLIVISRWSTERNTSGILRVVEKVEIIRKIKACRAPKDNKFLELAISGQAEVIITSDKDLLILHPYQSIQIITPAQYLNEK